MELIDRDELLKVLPTTRGLPDTPYSDYIMGKIAAMQDVVTIIKCAPTIDAEPVRHGRWVDEGNGLYSCSECQIIDHREPRHKYCPECGCIMDLEEGEVRG